MNNTHTSLRQQSRWIVLFAFAMLGVAFAPVARAAVFLWNPPTSLTDTNWSNGNNWSNLTAVSFGTAPGSADSAEFFDAGAVGTNGLAGTNVLNSQVDANITVGTLLFGQTNGNHAVIITNGATLSVIGALTNLFIGNFSGANASSTQQDIVVIKGAGGTLLASNTAGAIYVAQGNAANGSATQRSTLDLSGLDVFTAYENRIQVGERGNGLNVQNATGTLLLAKTNLIQLYASVGTAYTNTATANATYAIGVGENDGNAGGQNFLYLGLTNALFVDGIAVGRNKTTSFLQFNPNFTNSNPVAYIRGTNGANSRVTFWTIGDMQSTGSSSSQAAGTADFSNGRIDAKVDTLSLGRDRSGGNTGANPNAGTFSFTSGTLDVNTLLLGNQSYTATANSNPQTGLLNVNGPTATLVVNTVLVLGKTTTNSTAALRTQGTLNVRNGTVLANSIIAGVNNTNSIIFMTNGTLVLTNNAGTLVKAITLVGITNSTIQFNVTAANNNYLVVSNLVTGGSTNILNPASVGVFSSYPAQVVLIKYFGTGTIGGAGYNFGFGANTLPLSAPGAYLSNNVANKSIDLVLPNDPRPLIGTQPLSYAGSPGDNVTFTIAATSPVPLTYQWQVNGTNLTNGLSANGSTIAGADTTSVTLSAAQAGDSGNYTAVVTSIYGTNTSSIAQLIISSNNVAPIIQGLNNQTAVAGTNLTISPNSIGKPLVSRQWYVNGTNIFGETGASLTLNNVQYSQNGFVYSLVASNVAGVLSNSMTLTVIVTPSISVQPQSLTVTNTQVASFKVTASGVPNPTYQWSKNGTAISSGVNATAITSNLVIASAAPADIATYSVVIQNSAGSVTSSNVTLTVNSTMVVTSVSPTNGVSGICYDTPLTINFDRTVLLRNSGKIRIFNSNNNSTPVDTLDLGLNAPNNAQSRSAFAGDSTSFNYFPVIAGTNGTSMTIYPHTGAMTSNQTYYVTIDDGVFTDSTGAYFAGISANNVWSFTTKVGGPANPRSMVVDANGTGDFVTLQGAIDSVTLGNTNATLINVHNGNYVELVDIAGKHNISIHGQSRAGTLIGYANNANIATGGSTASRMAFKINANDIEIENLTITNRTVIGGSQAEALMINTGAARFVLNNAALGSYQDTLLANTGTSVGYFNNCLISGAFDYIWGGGNLFLTNCEIRTLVNNNGVLNNGNVTAARTDVGVNGNWLAAGGLFSSNGFSFVNCRFTRDSNGIVNTTLAGANGTANGVDSWIGCSFDVNYVVPGSAVLNAYLLWEYGNSNIDNTATKTFGLSAGTLSGPALTLSDARYLAAVSSTNWLNKWVPDVQPVIATQPVGQTVSYYQSASFTVAAQAAPSGFAGPSYQWTKNGVNIPGATSATYSLTHAQVDDSGTYAVKLIAKAGIVTSTGVVLTVNPVALSITANNRTNIFGPGVVFAGTEFTSSGLLGGDTITNVTLTSSGAAAQAAPGNYSIVPSAPLGITVDNYSITYNNGNLHIEQPPVAQASANGSAIFEGGSGNASLTVNNPDSVHLTYGFVSTGNSSLTTARAGAVTVDGSGNVSYSNASDFNGSDVIKYYVTDGYSYSTGTLSVAVSFVNDIRPAVFTNGVNYGSFHKPLGIAVADYTGDHKLDVAMVSYQDNAVIVWPGNGTGALNSASAILSTNVISGRHGAGYDVLGAAGLTTVGSNLVVVSEGLLGETNAWVDILKNSAGTFTKDSSLAVAPGAIVAASGALAGKGIAALAVGGTYQETNGIVQIWRKVSATSSVWINSATRILPNAPVESIAIGNLSGNTNLDVVVAADPNQVIVLTGNGNGTLAVGQASYTVGSFPYSVSVGDLNNDGVADVVTANHNSDDISVLLGTNNAGTVSLVSGGSYGVGDDVGWKPYTVRLADLNRDGRLDAVVALDGVDAIMVLQGQAGANVFRFLWEDSDVFFSVGQNPETMALGDLNNDGNTDVVVANYGSDDVTVLLNNYAPMTSGNQTLAVLEDTAKSITLRGSLGPLDYWLTQAPTNGNLTGAGIGTEGTAGAGYMVIQTNTESPVTVSYRGLTNAYGRDSFQYVVWDGVKTSAVATVTLNVSNVNDAPTFSFATNPVVVLEDSGLTAIVGAVTNIGPGAANEIKDTESFTLALNTPAQSNLFKVKPALDKTGKLTFTVAANQFGTAVVNVAEKDTGGTFFGGVDTTTGSFTIQIQNVNDAPVISSFKPMVINEGDTTNFTVTLTDLETPPDLLTLTGAVDKVEFFPAGVFTQPPVINSGQIDLVRADGNDTNGQWIVQLHPAFQAFGKVTITLSAVDANGLAATNRSAVLTINAINDPPSYHVVASALTTGNTALLATNSLLVADTFNVGDGNTFETNQSLKFFVTGNTAPTLFHTVPAVATNGTLSFVLKGGTSIGTASFGIYAQDNGGIGNGGWNNSATNFFTVHVTNVLDVPSALNLTATTLEDTAKIITLKGTNYDAFDPGLDPGLHYIIVGGPTYGTLDTNSLNIEYSNSYPTVTYTPSANYNGSDLFQYRVYTASYTSAVAVASITVTAVNDKPTFTLSTNTVSASTNGTLVTVLNFATSISAGAADESGQPLTFVLTGFTAASYGAGGAPKVDSTTGTLTFTPKAGKLITDTITLTLKDTGSPAQTSLPATFTISVHP